MAGWTNDGTHHNDGSHSPTKNTVTARMVLSKYMRLSIGH